MTSFRCGVLPITQNSSNLTKHNFLINLFILCNRQQVYLKLHVTTVVPTKSDIDEIFRVTLILHSTKANANRHITCVLILSCG